MAKVLIIGAGPAGISAALYAKRGGLDVTIVTKGPSTGGLTRAESIENYYGLAEPISGVELAARGVAGAKRLGVNFIESELLSLTFNDSFTGFKAETKAEILEADSVILAAGAARKSLAIPGIKEFAGKGVSYCAICDAFFYRKKTVVVIGSGEYALHEAQTLLPHTAKVMLLTNGQDLTVTVPPTIEVHTEKLAAITGEERVTGVEFIDGTSMAVDGVFMAIGTAGSTDIARKIGAMLDGNNIKVDNNMATNVPGLYAAGDCTGGLLQIAKAVHEGAIAGLAVVKYLRDKAKKA